jgi:predicted O-methyltransferase YrrM
MPAQTVPQPARTPDVPIDEIEKGLSKHRVFADVSYIDERFVYCMLHRLDRVSAALPGATELAKLVRESAVSALHHVVGDTVVRCAILHAHTQVESNSPYGLPLELCSDVMMATAEHVATGRRESPLVDHTMRRIDPSPALGWLWSGARHSNDLFGRTFERLVKDHYQALPATPREQDIATLRRGVELLRVLVPELAGSALAHTHTVALIPSEGGWEGTASGSQFKLGGSVFLSRELGTPWWVAEHLLHESLHQKLYDFRQGHSLLEFGLGADETSRIWSPWNPRRLRKANYWDIGRVLAAFHVYVHLALFALVAEQRAAALVGEFGPPSGLTDSRTALNRARYLGEKLGHECWQYLGVGGQQIVQWLRLVLDLLDHDPAPEGSFVHLCLDLYEREAQQVDRVLAAGVRPLSAEVLAALTEDEIQVARTILAAHPATRTVSRFDAALSALGPDVGSEFGAVRRAIADALMSISPDGFRIDGAADERIKTMVEYGSETIHAALAGYPPAVTAAKVRAADEGFGASCADDVGRLLAVFSNVVPQGGRILEIGGGVGVGTAWIVSGLGDRTDVAVVSVEIEEALARCARERYAWPPHVDCIGGDAATLLAGEGSFDLIFADAAPYKYEHLDQILEHLRPHGLLLIDDLTTDARTPDEVAAVIEALRQRVCSHPKLRAVELSAGKGVLLASKA